VQVAKAALMAIAAPAAKIKGVDRIRRHPSQVSLERANRKRRDVGVEDGGMLPVGGERYRGGPGTLRKLREREKTERGDLSPGKIKRRGSH